MYSETRLFLPSAWTDVIIRHVVYPTHPGEAYITRYPALGWCLAEVDYVVKGQMTLVYISRLSDTLFAVCHHSGRLFRKP